MQNVVNYSDDETVYSKLDIAKEYLNTAMQCYLDGVNYFSAMHLAGAAEELLGRWLHETDRSFTRHLKAQKAMATIETGKTPTDKEIINYLNWSKNAIKHMDDCNPHIQINPISEARYWIGRAIKNHDNAGFPKSAIMRKYEDFRAREI